MTSVQARTNEICRLSRLLYESLFSLDSSQFPGDWLHQLGKSTLSIGSNWVEGIGRRGTPKSPVQFFRTARASAYEAAFQFTAVGMIDLASVADEVADMIDEAIASKSYVDGEDSAGEPLKDVVAHRAGTAVPGQAKVRGGSHAVPALESGVAGRPGLSVVGSPAVRNLEPSEGTPEDESQDEGSTTTGLKASGLPPEALGARVGNT